LEAWRGGKGGGGHKEDHTHVTGQAAVHAAVVEQPQRDVLVELEVALDALVVAQGFVAAVGMEGEVQKTH